MGTRKAKNVLQLEGTVTLPALEGLRVMPVSNETEAARQVLEEPPAFLVAQADVPWHMAFVSSLVPERRPATLVIGHGAPVDPQLADEWVVPEASREELDVRLTLARTRARMRRKASRRAYLDSLTGLPNRRALVRGLLRELQRARRNETPLSVVLIDLDGFKQINDREGHPAGDRVLRKVGSALRRTTRANELCGRFGGDEFAIVISGDVRQAEQAAIRATQALVAAGAPGTAVACGLRSDETLKAFYRRADRALQTAKELRRTVPIGNTPRPSAVQVADEWRWAKG